MKLRNYLLGLGLGVALALGGYWAGFSKGSSLVLPSTESSTSTVVREIETERRPDGTVVERRKETENTSSNSSKQAVAAQPKWSASGMIAPDISKFQVKYWELTGYRRVADTNLWIGAGMTSRFDLLLGLRIDF